MLEQVPWFTGGGAEHSPEIARDMARAATSGSMGVVGAGDLQVRQLNTAGTSVRIAPGTGIMPNRYPGGANQSYIGRNATESQLAVPASGSSGAKAYLLILRVFDPQYGGATAPDPKTYKFQDFVLVPCSATATDLGAGAAYPYVPLARLNVPANTATITQAMITDVRDMAMPRRKRSLSTDASIVNEVQTATVAAGELWPNAGATDGRPIAVPEWATQVRAVVQWCQVVIPAGNATGYLWLQIGNSGGASTFQTESVGYDTAGATSPSRSTFTLGITASIPVAMRGTVQSFSPRAKNSTKSSDAARIKMDGFSAMVMDLEFLEAPTQDNF